MKVKVLASGSKGNSCLVLSDAVKVLIDVGVSYQHIEREFSSIGISPMEIDKVLITHTHADHVKGLAVFLRKTGLKVSIPYKMKDEMLKIVREDQIEYLDDVNQFADLEVELIHTSHDTACSVGFIIGHCGVSMVYVTDTGYINRKYLGKMRNKDLYVLESNHDEKMLMDGPYPYYLKQRVISDSGHLSNKMASKYLSESVGESTKYIILAHISEKNNTEEKAYQEMCDRLEGTVFHGKILIARQNESTDLIEV